jgi:hypothetical protein
MTTTNILAQIQNRKNRGNTNAVLEDIFSSWVSETKKDTTNEYPLDILVLSCALQRTTQGQPFSARFNRSLNNPELKDLATDLDVQKASNIRDYYKNKLIMLTLRDYKLTKFRSDLNQFLYSDPTKVLESHTGLVYKLPYLYDYDQEVDEIFQSSYFRNNQDNSMTETMTRKLSFIKKVEKQRKHSHSIEYWFNDGLNKVMLDFPVANPLLHLLDEKINQGPLCINARYFKRRKDLVEFFVCDKWSFA